MEETKIRPALGRPMDDATFSQYLQQSDFPVKINIKGRIVLDYDLQIIIQNRGSRMGGFTYTLNFGNYFKNHPKVKSFAIQPGMPFKQKTLLAFFDPKSDHIRDHAVELDVVVNGDKFKVVTPAGDKKRIVQDIVQNSLQTDKPIELPKIYNSVIIIKCSLKELPGKEFLLLNIDSISKPRVSGHNDEDLPHKNKASFLLNVVAKKEKMDTDILTRIDKDKGKRNLIPINVTPLMAEDIMTRNVKNRQLKYETVFQYDAEMREDEWEYTNESTVGTDINGHLIDGQHRLMAIIKSGTAQDLVIFTGLREKARAKMNIGRLRTGGDTMSMMGIGDPNQSAANVSLIVNMITYNWPKPNKKGRGGVTNADIAEFMSNEDNAERIKHAYTMTEKVFHKNAPKLMSKTIWTAMFYLLTLKKKAAAEEFFTRLSTFEKVGTGDETSPIYYLRKMLDNWGRNAKLQPAGFWGTVQRMRYIITAWNHYVAGETIDKLIVDAMFDGDGKPVPLPKINK